VLARIDPSCAPKSLAVEHPEWFARDRKGNFCEVSEHYVTCPNAEYYRGRIVEVVREMLVRYDADGIWNNQGKFAAWDTGACYCNTCQSMFRAESGQAIPDENWDDPVWRQYNEWRYRRIADWVALMHREIHAVKSDALFIAAVQLMESLETIRPGGWDIDYWLEHQDIPTFECQRRHTAPWWPGIQAKYLSTLAPDKRYSPPLGTSRQPRIFMSVDLPEPLGPMMATNSPASICRSMPFRTRSVSASVV